jgi:hypothetical protein
MTVAQAEEALEADMVELLEEVAVAVKSTSPTFVT